MVAGIINEIHPEISCCIIACLSAKEAMRFRVTAKKFRSLVILIPDKLFDDSIDVGSFQHFVDNLLGYSREFRIRRFTVKLNKIDETSFGLLDRCVRDVLRRGVIELNLSIKNFQHPPSLPIELFRSDFIESLRIAGFLINNVPPTASLPALKTLITDDTVTFDAGNLKLLLSSCPLLDVLIIHGSPWDQARWTSIKDVTLSLPRPRTAADYIFDIEEASPFEGYTELRRSLVEHITIRGYEESHLNAVQNILASFPSLEKLHVGFRTLLALKREQFMEDILKLPKASQSCEVLEIKPKILLAVKQKAGVKRSRSSML